MNEIIYYRSPVGALCIAKIDDAVASVCFANSKDKITVNENEINYGKTNSSLVKNCIQQLDEYFAGTRFDFQLELAQPGTLFQQSVWAELLKINYGKTLSYLTLSKRLGNAKAIRAVGTANGRNNIAIIVPCHRVIGSNGTLVGYAGDLWRKKWLLDHEAKFGNGVQSLF
ncbi:MAG: methylated-DNA--[protein]-cysteine S-methyltransferase [Ferruginibacter sp.]